MGKRLYVGNLAYTVTEPELRALFGAAGVVEDAKIGLDGPAGHARGFAFVEMGSDEEASQAMALLSGRELHGRRLNVKEPPDPALSRRFGRGRRPQARREPS